jgi:hypothetical protein
VKRISIGILAAIIVAGLGSAAIASPNPQQPSGNIGQQTVAQADMTTTNAANFGSAPSGTVPILYNDHHVYSKPDKLKAGRVLAALVRGGTVLIPLRSMFEQMGATVSYDAGSKTVDVTKPGADVKVTVGSPEVIINGESRPLDVPPEIYQGSVVVPVRVISEGMGAYVQWVPSQHVVVVRYNPATPPPAATPAPTEAPTVAPTPTPAPAATPNKEGFIAGDYIINPKVYNEFSPGNTGKGGSYAVRGAFEFDALGLPWMIEGDFRQIQYPHNQGVATPPVTSPCPVPGDQGCVTTIGGAGSTFVPAFTAREQDFDGRLALKVADPRIYIGVGYLYRTGNYGYPALKGFGFGAEKLPDLNQAFSLYGSAWYYPNVKGNFTDPLGNQFNLAYNMLKYQIGGTVKFGSSPVFLDLGYLGETAKNKSNAPSNTSVNGPYVGLGIKF